MIVKATGVVTGILSLALLGLIFQECNRYRDYKEFVDEAADTKFEKIIPTIHTQTYSDMLEHNYQAIRNAHRVFVEGK